MHSQVQYGISSFSGPIYEFDTQAELKHLPELEIPRVVDRFQENSENLYPLNKSADNEPTVLTLEKVKNLVIMPSCDHALERKKAKHWFKKLNNTNCPICFKAATWEQVKRILVKTLEGNCGNQKPQLSSPLIGGYIYVKKEKPYRLSTLIKMIIFEKKLLSEEENSLLNDKILRKRPSRLLLVLKKIESSAEYQQQKIYATFEDVVFNLKEDTRDKFDQAMINLKNQNALAELSEKFKILEKDVIHIQKEDISVIPEFHSFDSFSHLEELLAKLLLNFFKNKKQSPSNSIEEQLSAVSTALESTIRSTESETLIFSFAKIFFQSNLTSKEIFTLLQDISEKFTTSNRIFLESIVFRANDFLIHHLCKRSKNQLKKEEAHSSCSIN